MNAVPCTASSHFTSIVNRSFSSYTLIPLTLILEPPLKSKLLFKNIFSAIFVASAYGTLAVVCNRNRCGSTATELKSGTVLTIGDEAGFAPVNVSE